MSKARDFTKEEDDIIRKYYPTLGAEQTAKYLPGRRKQQVSKRAYRLGLHVTQDRRSEAAQEANNKYKEQPALSDIEARELALYKPWR